METIILFALVIILLVWIIHREGFRADNVYSLKDYEPDRVIQDDDLSDYQSNGSDYQSNGSDYQINRCGINDVNTLIDNADVMPWVTPDGTSYTMDEKLTLAQHHRAGLDKRAIDGRVRATKDKFQKYFQDELDETANRPWWEDVGDDGLETDFGPDINPF